MSSVIKPELYHHRAFLARWLLYKYKSLWSVGGKGQGSSLQTLHIYTFRVGLIVRMKKLENRNGEGVEK